jgi:hypothetical protein
MKSVHCGARNSSGIRSKNVGDEAEGLLDVAFDLGARAWVGNFCLAGGRKPAPCRE